MNQQPELLLDFGKYKGRRIDQVDNGYLQWMFKSFSARSQWHKAAADALLLRTRQREAEQGICSSLLSDLKSCSLNTDLSWGRRIHEDAVKTGTDSNLYVASALIKMYAKCGSMLDARRVFDGLRTPNVVCWTALLLGYAENGQGLVALELFSKMKADGGCVPDSVTYVAALKACTTLAVKGGERGKAQCLKAGKEIHSQIASGLDRYVENTLIDMYAKCGSIADARHVFETMQKPDVVSWNALLLGYAESGEEQVSLELFSKMKASGCAPDSVTYVAALKACLSLAAKGRGRVKADALELGRRIHSQAGDHLDPYVRSTLIGMYSKCGSMTEAYQVFQTIKKPEVVSWTALLSGYAENGEGNIALELFSRMKTAGCAPDSITYVAVLKACTSLAVNGDKVSGLESGRQVHLQIGNHLDTHLQNTLIDLYAKCGSMADARQVFDSVQKPDVVSWNALLRGYADNGEGHTTLQLFSKMKCEPDSVTYVAALKACMSLVVKGDDNSREHCLQCGRNLHVQIGDHLDLFVQSTLIDMYAKCGSMIEARKVFDSIQWPDAVCWNALLLGYAENGEAHTSLELMAKMKADRCLPDSLTYVAALKACTSLAVNENAAEGLETGRKIHLQIGHHLNIYVQSTLIDMYAKCGSMAEARTVFESIQKPTVVAWTALLLGYAENGEGHVSLDLFCKMVADGCSPDPLTYAAALKACASIATHGDCSRGLEMGREIHLQIGDQHLDLYVQNSLINMYSKCSSMIDARQVFNSIAKPDVVAWNCLLLGYAENGEACVCLNLFSKMKADGHTPDSVTYIAAIKACAVVGALGFGRMVHSDLTEFSVPVVSSLVDFYAKCGSMVEAQKVFDWHSDLRDISTWTALLAGYSACGDTNSVFKLFEAMQDMGFRPDGVTFLCVLLCCNHAGLARKARQYLEAMPVQYGVTPDAYHYNCMVDVLGRAKQLNEAVSLLRIMPCKPNAVTWSALLSACHKWKNVAIGWIAFQALVDMNDTDASAYVLMARIYASRGMWEEQARVLCSVSLSLGVLKSTLRVRSGEHRLCY